MAKFQAQKFDKVHPCAFIGRTLLLEYKYFFEQLARLEPTEDQNYYSNEYTFKTLAGEQFPASKTICSNLLSVRSLTTEKQYSLLLHLSDSLQLEYIPDFYVFRLLYTLTYGKPFTSEYDTLLAPSGIRNPERIKTAKDFLPTINKILFDNDTFMGLIQIPITFEL